MSFDFELYFNVLILRDEYYIHYNFVQQFDNSLQKVRRQEEESQIRY